MSSRAARTTLAGAMAPPGRLVRCAATETHVSHPKQTERARDEAEKVRKISAQTDRILTGGECERERREFRSSSTRDGGHRDEGNALLQL